MRQRVSAREIAYGDFNVAVINHASGMNNIEQEGIEPVLLMLKDQG